MRNVLGSSLESHANKRDWQNALLLIGEHPELTSIVLDAILLGKF